MGAGGSCSKDEPMVPFAYTVTIGTDGDRRESIESPLSVVLVGSKGRSDALKLSEKLARDFISAKSDRFAETTTLDLGNVWLVEIDSAATNSYKWFVRQVVVTATRQQLPDGNAPKGKETPGVQTWTFPFYRWVGKHEEIREGHASLPAQEFEPKQAEQRAKELERQRAKFQYRQQESFPPGLVARFEDIRQEEFWSPQRNAEFEANREKVASAFLLDEYMLQSDRLERFEDFAQLARGMPDLPLAASWMSDETFGAERVRGAFCTVLERVTDLPPKFGVDREMIARYLRPNATLDSEIDARRVYMTDCAELENLRAQSGRYLACPMCLFYLNDQNKLLPIAIQLRQFPGDPSNPVYYPHDSQADWLFAKIIVSSADLIRHNFVTRICHTHLVADAFCISTYRQLPSVHPLYKLLKPHFKSQLGVNSLIRKSLVPNGADISNNYALDTASIDKLIKGSFDAWRFDQANPVADLARRNIDQKDLPQSYHYRDDGLAVWKEIKDYVKQMLSLYYKQDAELKLDTELKAWAAEIAEVLRSKKEPSGFPSSFEKLDDLVLAVSTMIWIVSCQHSVVTFTQYNSFGFIPAAPAALYAPLPGEKGKEVTKGRITMNDILAALPPKEQALQQLAGVWLLSTYSQHDDYLETVQPELLFTEPEAKTIITQFRSRLKGISNNISAGRKTWPYLSPAQVTASITM